MTFALPDLRGRIPIHQGNGFILAETGGAEEITLTVNQIPAHTILCWHPPGQATCNTPGGNVTAESAVVEDFLTPTNPTAAMARKPSARSAAASRTRIFNPTCASTSSFPCSGSSRAPT